MNVLNGELKVGVLGAGSMGSGIAQLAATKGHHVVLHDTSEAALQKAEAKINKILARLVEKGRISEQESSDISNRIEWASNIDSFKGCGLFIEAIIENLDIKKKVFAQMEELLGPDAVLATNTSSLSVAAIAAACKNPKRVIGIHFFNPAPLMPLVEIIPALTTDQDITGQCKTLLDGWGKTTVLAKDTPGFIVNRLARPFYGEAIRILEEGVADVPTIDWAMKELGGFRMGPFELMDFIGNDVNYTITTTVFEQFFYDPRYKPSFTQKRLVEAGRFGRKSGYGYYDYNEGAVAPEPNRNENLGQQILNRILLMLINEAVDALFLNIASRDDLDLAMTKGVNYPKGLLSWANELGLETVLDGLQELYEDYGEDRYRPSPLLKRSVRQGVTAF